MSKLFPSIIIGLNILASLFYLVPYTGNWRMILYWFAAAMLNYVVTW